MSLLSIYYLVLAAILAGILLLLFVRQEAFIRIVRRLPLATLTVCGAVWLGGLYLYGVIWSHKAGVTVSSIRPATNTKPMIVFLHGWVTDASSWNNVIELVGVDPRFEDFGFAIVDFASANVFDRDRTLGMIGKEIADKLASEFLGQNLYIVTHSAGGLLGRQAVLELAGSAATTRVIKLVSYAPPHEGTDAAKFAGVLGMPQQLLLDLRENSAYVTVLLQRWRHARIAGVPLPHERCILSAGDVVVSLFSAKAGCQEAIELGNWGHTSIHQPVDRIDERYQALADGLIGTQP